MVSRSDSMDRTQPGQSSIRTQESMGCLALEWWLVILGVTFLGVGLMLHALTAGLRDVQRSMELKVEVRRLREEYDRRTEKLRGRSGGIRPEEDSGSAIEV